MKTIDWSIIFLFFASLLGIAWFFKRYTKSVADFLSANRCAKRYLLAAADGAAGTGAISIVAYMEMYNAAGFTPAYWEMILMPLGLVLALSGWIIYRFRQTRCMTMAQFLEVRYSKSFRIFSGFVAFVSGIVNYGIFPAVTARFFVYSLGLPPEMQLVGFTVPTFAVVMFCLLVLALYITLNGGQIVIIVTDFVQGQFMNIVFALAVVTVLVKISWPEITDALMTNAVSESRVNPYDTKKADTFSYTFFLILLFGRFYGYMCWQGSQAYNSSAKTPHEARMSRIIGQWRSATMAIIPMTLAVGAYVILTQPQYADTAAQIQSELSAIGNEQIQTQMTTPVALKYLLPTGVLGLFVAVMFAAGISTDSTYLHSWGSIFLQDVVMPFRKKPFSTKMHLKLLRLSIFGVAVFAFFFSLLFKQTEYIVLFFQLTGALFISGAGVCVIGGLYWRKGTSVGAWGAMITGVVLVLGGFYLDRTDPDFPLNYIQIVFVSKLCASLVYIVLSLLTWKGKPFDLDRMLHRGKYAEKKAEASVPPLEEKAASGQALTWLQKRLGINDEFNRTDRFIYYATISLCFGMLLTFFGCLIWNFAFQPDFHDWMRFWKVFIYVQLTISVTATLWVLFGGIRDLRDMCRDLKLLERNDSDDGFVVHGHNAGEEKVFKEIAKEEKVAEVSEKS